MKRRKNTDAEYREWISRQPSCLTGEFSQWLDGEGRNPACHVKRASTGGIAYKGLLCCVPMRQEERAVQHQHGEKACLERYLGGSWSVEKAKAWFDAKVIEYRERWERLHR